MFEIQALRIKIVDEKRSWDFLLLFVLNLNFIKNFG